MAFESKVAIPPLVTFIDEERSEGRKPAALFVALINVSHTYL
jgi:hypothetical protein